MISDIVTILKVYGENKGECLFPLFVLDEDENELIQCFFLIKII